MWGAATAAPPRRSTSSCFRPAFRAASTGRTAPRARAIACARTSPRTCTARTPPRTSWRTPCATTWENPNPTKPLVASLHGSPGVGQSYFHQLLAQALYDAVDDDDHDHLARDAIRHFAFARRPPPRERRRVGVGPRSRRRRAFVPAPRRARPTRRVVPRRVRRGVDPRARRLSALAGAVSTRDAASRPGRLRQCPARTARVQDHLRHGLRHERARGPGAATPRRPLDHLARFPESVVVVEEYDKMSCPARGTQATPRQGIPRQRHVPPRRLRHGGERGLHADQKKTRRAPRHARARGGRRRVMKRLRLRLRRLRLRLRLRLRR